MNPVYFAPRWREELVCTMDGGSFIVEMTMGVATVYFPTSAKWVRAAPEWAKPHWERVHQDLAAWCKREKIPLRIEDDAWVQFEWRMTTFTTYSVLVVDMAHYMDEEGEHTVKGFPTLELAQEYARRRTRDSLEEQRSGSSSREDLRARWHSFGEDCLVVGDTYCGGHELDFFIAHPATPEERDWSALTPRRATSV